MLTETAILILAALLESKCLLLVDTEPVLADTFKGTDEDIDKMSVANDLKLRNFLKSTKKIVNKKLAFKDAGAYCDSLRTCAECVRAVWYPCSWCHNYGCTHIGESLCPYASYTFKKNAEDNMCPSISYQGYVLIASEVKSNIRVRMNTVDPSIYEKDIMCELKLKDKTIRVKGLLLNDMVYCYSVTLTTPRHSVTENGIFRLVWGGVDPFSNEIPVIVYSCGTMAEDCDSCRLLPAEYQCGWCEQVNRCVVAEHCVTDYLRWSLSKLKCPAGKKHLLYV